MDLKRQIQWNEALRSVEPARVQKIIDQIEPIEIGGVHAPLLSSPLFLTGTTAETNSEQLDQFIDFTVRLYKYAQENKESDIFTRLYNSLTDGGKQLVDMCNFESEYSLKSRFRRIDAFIDVSNQMKIIEMNQAAPLAISFYERARTYLLELSKLTGIELEVPSLTKELGLWFFEEYKQRFGSEVTELTVLVAVETGYVAKFVDLPRATKMIADCMQQLGRSINFIIAEPTDVTLKNSAVYCSGKKIDLIWRNTVYLTPYSGIDDYKSIMANPKNNLIVNSTASWLTRSKEVFSLVWNDSVCQRLGLSEQYVQKLRAYIPYTFTPYYDGADALHSKEKWVLKPSDSGFGKGIVFSENNSDWKSQFQQALGNPGIVIQEHVHAAEAMFSRFTETGLTEELLSIDYDPYITRGQYRSAALVRAIPPEDFASSTKMNIVEGARITLAVH